jgi:hypothetical protein
MERRRDVTLRPPLRLEEVAVAPELQRAQLRLRLADEIALMGTSP